MKSKRGVIVFDVGGTYIKACLINDEFQKVIQPFETPSNSNSSSDFFFDSIEIILQKIKKEVNHVSIDALLFTMPGPFDYSHGISYMKHKFLSLYGINLREELKRRLNYDGKIFFENDAIAFMKYAIHHDKINRNAIAITLGTGLGYVLYQNNEIERTEWGSPNEVLYNVPYLGKTMEDYFSARGLLSFYQGKEPVKTSYDLFLLAQKKDENALLAFAKFGKAFGTALKPLLQKHQVNTLVLGGQVSKSACYFLPSLQKELENVTILVRTQDCPALYGLAYEYYLETMKGDKNA